MFNVTISTASVTITDTRTTERFSLLFGRNLFEIHHNLTGANTRLAMQIKTAVKQFVMSKKLSKLSYSKRLEMLGKKLQEAEAHSFRTLVGRLNLETAEA